jgi:hypothetical protein
MSEVDPNASVLGDPPSSADPDWRTRIRKSLQAHERGRKLNGVLITQPREVSVLQGTRWKNQA